MAKRTITGTVTNQDGEGAIGATIMIKGTTTGEIVDFDGKYSLNAEINNVLVFSLTHYSGKEVIVGISDVIDVTLYYCGPQESQDFR